MRVLKFRLSSNHVIFRVFWLESRLLRLLLSLRPFPSIVAVLERVHQFLFFNFLRNLVPLVDYSNGEKVLSGISFHAPFKQDVLFLMLLFIFDHRRAPRCSCIFRLPEIKPIVFIHSIKALECPECLDDVSSLPSFGERRQTNSL